MRVVVVGASGNVGTSVLASLAEEQAVDVLGVSRRRPESTDVEWAEADITTDDLGPLFRGADAVVHLAWAIQPSRDADFLRRTNVDGSSRVFRAAVEAGVQAVVHASSVGVYSPGPKTRLVDESWRRDGVQTSFYSRHKAEVEAMLDRFEAEQPDIRVVRMRPALIFKREAASGIRRLFAGPFMPSPLLRSELIRVLPWHPNLRIQGVHSHDVGDAYRLALMSDVRGAFNVAAEPVLDGAEIGRLLGARPIRVPRAAIRAATDLSWRLRLQPTPAGWVDLGFSVPLMDSSRAREELGWRPAHSATDALREVIEGIRERTGAETPPLEPDAGGPMRAEEIASGVGGRDPAARDD